MENKLIPFIRLFHSTPRYLWENEVGENVDMFQGEGGEKGGPPYAHAFQFGAT